MLLLIIIGIVLLAVGKLKLTRSIVLTGKRARLYGLTLVITAVPYGLIVGGIIAAVAPEAILANPGLRIAMNYALVITYLVLMALPFRDRANPDDIELPQPSA